MLRVEALTTYYGNHRAIEDLSLEVREGEIVTLIGANGAGKSTTLMTISGIVRPRSGAVHFMDRRLDQLPAYEIARRGIVHVPEGRRILPSLTIEENLDLGGFRQSVSARRHLRQRIYGQFPRLKERRHQLGGTLSGGEQQMLAIGRALMAEPRMLLLDEPSLGLAPKIIEQIFDVIQDLNRQGTTVLLVEQNAAMALEIADRGYVLETGRMVMADSAAKLRDDPLVRRAYLGL
jgi:branched-chain amino acid transport system ATP-binding protein